MIDYWKGYHQSTKSTEIHIRMRYACKLSLYRERVGLSIEDKTGAASKTIWRDSPSHKAKYYLV